VPPGPAAQLGSAAGEREGQRREVEGAGGDVGRDHPLRVRREGECLHARAGAEVDREADGLARCRRQQLQAGAPHTQHVLGAEAAALAVAHREGTALERPEVQQRPRAVDQADLAVLPGQPAGRGLAQQEGARQQRLRVALAAERPPGGVRVAAAQRGAGLAAEAGRQPLDGHVAGQQVLADPRRGRRGRGSHAHILPAWQPHRVRAIQVTRLDGPSAVELTEVPEPDGSGDVVLVDVQVAGVAYPDVLLSKGLYQYKPELPFTLGGELAGVVRSAPEGSGFAAGDRVAGLSMVGGWADVAAVPVGMCLPLPDGISFAAGAGLPMNYLTMDFALRVRARLQPGETVLVHGAAGGLGVATLQLAGAMGARTIAVVSDEDKARVAREAGAHETVLLDGWLAAVKELTGGRGVDVVCDPVGGERFLDSVRSLAEEGRLVVLGFVGGIPTVTANRLLLKNVSVVGAGWGAFVLGKPGYLRGQWDALLPMLADGRIRAVEGSARPLAEAGAALAELDERRVRAKVVLTLR